MKVINLNYHWIAVLGLTLLLGACNGQNQINGKNNQIQNIKSFSGNLGSCSYSDGLQKGCIDYTYSGLFGSDPKGEALNVAQNECIMFMGEFDTAKRCSYVVTKATCSSDIQATAQETQLTLRQISAIDEGDLEDFKNTCTKIGGVYSATPTRTP